MPDRPTLSVVIPTVRGWGPTLGRTYQGLCGQIAETGAELLIVDGSRGWRRAPILPHVRWVPRPGRSVAQLREAGLMEAQGEVVAITEDHCVVADDWCAAILRAHRSDDAAAAVGGSVDTGSRDAAVDLASFYAGHAPSMAPLPRGVAVRLDGINVSYKRRALDAFRDEVGAGTLEMFGDEWLARAGERLVADDRIRVAHYQSYGTLGTAVMHFHGGRSFEGQRRAGDGPVGRLLRAARCLAVPLPRAVRRLATARAKGEPPGLILRAAPLMVWVMWAQAAGELAGVAAGPGDSPQRLH